MHQMNHIERLDIVSLVLQMALSLWNTTGNVQTWFHRLSMREGGFTTSYEDLGDFDEDFRIQKKLATKICEFIFENDIALLTVEIAQPRILELVKDIKVTFPDMLGTIGKKECACLPDKDPQG